MSPSLTARGAGSSKPFQFEGLPFYTRDEAAVWNWCRRFFRDVPDWKLWVQEAWGDLLTVPAGFEIAVLQRHSVETGQEERKTVFQQPEIFIGREADNDIAIPTRSAAKRHARIFIEKGHCFVEDLGTSLGTYLNQGKVLPGQPAAVKNGDLISIFPHLFEIRFRHLWAPQGEISLYPADSEPMTWQAFKDKHGAGRASFSIDIHPVGGALCLEASRAFLSEFVDRLLRPLGLEWPPSFLSPADSGVLEFVILCLIERVNREFAFPFQFEPGPCGSKPAFSPGTRGVMVSCAISLLSITGVLRIFAPYSLMEAMRRAVPDSPPAGIAPGVSWQFPISAGHALLSVADLAGLERNDVILLEPEFEVLFPGESNHGWKASGSGGDDTVNEISQIGNLSRLRIDNYFERVSLNNEDSQTGEVAGGRVPDLDRLPLRVHVIVAEKELTLSEAGGLKTGTILELGCDKTGAVSLAINGKILGDGQLVEVEGKLGVKILSWKGA
jgi:flagellar motor switch/type III secretory pathway protein FliN